MSKKADRLSELRTTQCQRISSELLPLRVVSPISFTSGYNRRQWTLAPLPSLFKESTDEGSLSLTADLATRFCGRL